MPNKTAAFPYDMQLDNGSTFVLIGCCSGLAIILIVVFRIQIRRPAQTIARLPRTDSVVLNKPNAQASPVDTRIYLNVCM